MKITLESRDKIFTIETDREDLNIGEMADILKGLLVQAGFHPGTVDAAFDVNNGNDRGSWELR